MEKSSTTGSTPYLIVGLGNPGSRYATTRHNIGFLVVEAAAHRHGLSFSSKQGNAEIARGDILGQRVIVAKPQTFMNNSGMAVRALASFYKVPHERILIIYDEIALPVGTIRIRERGSSGGHNGVKSVVAHMGTEAIPRIRVGVDRPIDPRHSQIDWVLGRFAKEEHGVVEETIGRTVDAVESILTIGMERTMNLYNIPPSAGTKNEGRKSKSSQEVKSDKARTGISQQADDRPTGSPKTPEPKVVSPIDAAIDAARERLARIMHKEKQADDQQ